MSLLREWSFETREVSANVYQVTAVDKAGHKIEMTGTDPDELLLECQAAATKLLPRHGNSGSGT